MNGKLKVGAILFPVMVAFVLVSFKIVWGVTDLTLEGTVGNYPVVMEIQVWGCGPNIVGGSYYYKSQGPNKRIEVSGDLNLQNGDGVCPVLEESVNDVVTGTFHASYWDVKNMRGTWISASGRKQLPFELKVVNADHHYIE